MSIISQTNIEVKVFEPNNNQIKRNSKNTGTFQYLGSCRATITLKDDSVLFDNLHGFFGISTIDGRKPEIIVNYDNASEGPNGQKYPGSRPSDELAAILKIKTIDSYNKGFATNEYQENIAAYAGVETKDYIDMSKAAIEKALKSSDVSNESINNDTTSMVNDIKSIGTEI